METLDPDEIRNKSIENLILLLVGSGNEKISMLHLEKEVFLLWNFHPAIKEFINFIRYFRGPFSREIHESIINPLFLANCWDYTPPRRSDRLSGGYITITNEGKNDYKNIINKIQKEGDDDLLHLLTGIKMVRKLYDTIGLKELLLLIYDSYPEYIKESKVYLEIKADKIKLSDKLLKKGIIDEKRQEAIIKCF